jgi:tRNA A-37 threonylcarbamoyl transferase component Bud32
MASEFSPPGRALTWIVPPECQDVVNPQEQSELEAVLHSGELEQIYTMGRRSVYRGSLNGNRQVAVKEVCYKGLLRQFKLRYWREPKVLREFCSGCEYISKGGETPKVLGMAFEQNVLGLQRGFIFLEWLDNAITLTEYLRSRNCDVTPEFWDEVAGSLVVSAKTGLVHGGHSPENIMVVSEGDEAVLRFQVIDFADSYIFDRFHDAGFASDVARIGARLVTEGACRSDQVNGFVDAVIEAAWVDHGAQVKWLREIQSRIDALLCGRKKM